LRNTLFADKLRQLKETSMALNYPHEWRFEDEDFSAPAELVDELCEIVKKIAAGTGHPQDVVEGFKLAFGAEHRSTNLRFAYADLVNIMYDSAKNGAVFAEIFWTEVESLGERGIPVPTFSQINRLFDNRQFCYRLDPPKLVRYLADADILETNTRASSPTPSKMAYRILRRVGSGGFGTVFVARRSTNVADFDFALKVLDPSPFVNDFSRAQERFRREIKAVQRLSHRGIVQLVDAGFDTNQKSYLVMQLIEGTDIRIAASQQCSMPKRVWLMVDVLDAIAHAHSQNVLHRDLKPSNILVRSTDNQPIIVDFGLSYIIDELDHKTLTTSAAGTVGYIPIEVLTNPKHRSPQQDIYACGILTYEIIASRLPNPDTYESLTQVDPSLKELDAILQRAIGPATARYTEAGCFRDELRAALLRIENQ
jgi:hypothetical protein